MVLHFVLRSREPAPAARGVSRNLGRTYLAISSCIVKNNQSQYFEVVIYERWDPEPVTFETDEDGESKLGLAQYKLANWSHSEVYRTNQKVQANVSVISLHFAFHRQQGFYVLQIYIPLTLIVMCSWVTFWLRKTEKGQESGLRSYLPSFTFLGLPMGPNGILCNTQ